MLHLPLLGILLFNPKLFFKNVLDWLSHLVALLDVDITYSITDGTA